MSSGRRIETPITGREARSQIAEPVQAVLFYRTFRGWDLALLADEERRFGRRVAARCGRKQEASIVPLASALDTGVYTPIVRVYALLLLGIPPWPVPCRSPMRAPASLPARDAASPVRGKG
jgi:hypothetical protein